MSYSHTQRKKNIKKGLAKKGKKANPNYGVTKGEK